MRSIRHDRILTLQTSLLLGVGLLLLGLTLGVLMLQTHLQSWLLVHHRFVQAETMMVDALELYATTGDEAFLQRVDQAMTVPLGARKARKAADSVPVDKQAIREGLLQVGLDERDIAGAAWVYHWMGEWPYLEEALRLWREVDPDIDRLHALGQAMKADKQAGRLTPEAQRAYRDQIAGMRARIDNYTWKFADVLVSALRAVRVTLALITVLLFAGFVSLFVFILRKVVARIRRSEGWLRASFDQSNVGMLQLTADGGIHHANDAARRILRIEGGEDITQPLQAFVAEEERARFIDALKGAKPRGSVDEDTEYHLRAADGSPQVVRASITQVEVPDDDDRSGMSFAMIQDVTEAHAMRAELARQARYDHLTGLLSRSEVVRRITRCMKELEHGDISQLAVCLLDLDRFRYINESGGLRMGDRVLQVMARRLNEAIGDAGDAGRLGGDQFVIVLPGMGPEHAVAFAQRVSVALSQPDQALPDTGMTPTCSIGVVPVTRRYSSASEVLTDVHAACEQAKRAGRNRVQLLQTEARDQEPRRSPAEWANEIRMAMAEGRLELHAQRIVSCHPGDTQQQAEVLLRMRDSRGVYVSPGQFLPIAEMYGLGIDIDRQVLMMAADAIRAHMRRGGSPLVLYINLSATSVTEPDFGLFVRHMLDGEPGLARSVCMEITETGVMQNLDQATAFMDMVRQRGGQVALDDFGTGQSSFAQLRLLPIDIVKIDGSFVRDLERDATSEVLIRSICQMSHVLSKRTVVECVERPEDCERMRELGADYMQGFALHRPEPLGDFLARLH